MTNPPIPITVSELKLEFVAKAIYGEFVQRTDARVPRDIWPHLAKASIEALGASIEDEVRAAYDEGVEDGIGWHCFPESGPRPQWDNRLSNHRDTEHG